MDRCKCNQHNQSQQQRPEGHEYMPAASERASKNGAPHLGAQNGSSDDKSHVRCIVCIKTGAWPERLKDAEEIDVVEQQLAKSTYVDEESRKIAIEQAHHIDEAAHQRIGGGKP